MILDELSPLPYARVRCTSDQYKGGAGKQRGCHSLPRWRSTGGMSRVCRERGSERGSDQESKKAICEIDSFRTNHVDEIVKKNLCRMF
jgi:hypothetical protein